MASGDTTHMETNLSSLLKAAISDAQQLLEQRIDRLRDEFRDEIRKAQEAGLSLGAGAGMVAVGGILSGFMLVHLTNRVTGLPLWACYGLVGSALGAAGGQLLSTGASKASEVQLLPSNPAEAIQESVSAPSETPVGFHAR